MSSFASAEGEIQLFEDGAGSESLLEIVYVTPFLYADRGNGERYFSCASA